jgi:protein-disulfide isomerase
MSSKPPSLRGKNRPSRNVVLSVIAVLLFAAVVAVMISIETRRAGPEGGTAAAVRPESHRLSAVPGAKATFVEFLDFECEGCRAAYPDVEQLRERYAGRVEFVIRYFPLSGHFNGERAARAVEAAAQQGRLEPMYKLMFDTQSEWGEQRVPMDDRFREYAGRLGLDLARFDAAYNDPRTLERIQVDQRDGEALGVEGTPSFFVNGKKLEPESFDDITRAIDDALAGR